MLSPQDITAIKVLIDERFDWLGQILKSKFDSIDVRFDAADDRFDILESKIDRKLDTEVAYGLLGNSDRRISKLEDDSLFIKRKLGL
jgi:hypothetical protein